MVEEEPLKRCKIVLTPQFIEDLVACVEYIENELHNPLAAKKTYAAIKNKVLGLETLPQAASSYTSPATGLKRYRISYNRFDIHYSIEGNTVRVLGLKHQMQNDRWID